MLKNSRFKEKGFTLLEILIALFIFSMISLMLVGALRSVINAQSGTEKSAERLRDLQVALLKFSRDVEQAVNRPALNTVGKEEAAFMGDTRELTFTHLGFANPMGNHARSTMERTRYYGSDHAFSRMTWAVIDQAPQSLPHVRRLLSDVQVRFEYLDKEGRFHANWPVDGNANEPLPRAVRIQLTISQWGNMSQLYVIPAKTNEATPPPPKP